jgi:hypothetical protein
MAIRDRRGHHIAHDGGERQSIDFRSGWRAVIQGRGRQVRHRAARFTGVQRGFPGIALQRYSRHVHREIAGNHRNAVPHISPFSRHRDAHSEAPARPVNLAGEGASVRQCQKAGKTRWIASENAEATVAYNLTMRANTLREIEGMAAHSNGAPPQHG